MILTQRRLNRLRLYRRRILWTLLILFLIDSYRILASRPETVRVPVSAPSTAATTDSETRSNGGANRELQPQHQQATYPHPRDSNQTFFIASVHRNNEAILRSGWNDAVLALVDYLGPENVHFSSVESGSQDHTKDALIDLKAGLDRRGVTSHVVLGMTVWEQLDELATWPDPDADREPGWIWDHHEHHYALRRIPYLANVRNDAMRPLKMLERAEGRTFDKVLWLNDVMFDTSDFLTLLHTRGGDYSAVCSMDFKHYPLYYDTFALRDDRGDKTVSPHWPWFLSPRARAAVRSADPVRVRSCWNGVVLFDAAPFYADPPLAFRGVDDSLADLHLEASECCLVHADNAADPRGVWLNPNVRVGYTAEAWRRARADVRFPGSALAAVRGAWDNRWMRLRARVQFELEKGTVRRRLRRWREGTPRGELSRTEVGDFCLINEKQIMWQNGWKHL